MIPQEPEVWILGIIAVALVLLLAIWRRTDLDIGLSKIGLKFRAKAAEGAVQGRVDMLNSAVIEHVDAKEIAAQLGSGSEQSSVNLMNKAEISNSRFERIVGKEVSQREPGRAGTKPRRG